MNTRLDRSFDKSAHLLQHPSAAEQAQLANTILVVDDNQDDIFILHRALGSLVNHCRFLTAKDGVEAQTLLQCMKAVDSKSLPAAIISDINMPRLNGFGLIAWLKTQPRLANIPVVIVSTFEERSEIKKALGHGAIACLSKPPDPREAQNLVSMLLQRSRVERVCAKTAGKNPPLEAQVQRTTKRILLADDDAGIRETLGRVLESEHYEVVFAKNGQEAAAKSVSSEPDIVLLDLNMPDRDGWSAFRFMEAARPLLPIIVITARPNQYQEADQLGVDALMEKPLDLHVLLHAIGNLLSEPERDRTVRITNPAFKTALLNNCSRAGQTTWQA